MARQKLVGDDTVDVTLNFGEEETEKGKFVRHPVAVLFHLLFRLSAIATYILCGWFSDNFILNFVVIVVLLSMDFWTVKNVTGRLLVGLRWWNQVDEDGNSQWVFESRKGSNRNQITGTESRVFWFSLVLCQLFWFTFFFITLFSLHFKWFMVVCVGILLNSANLYGYIRCKVGTKEPLSSVAKNFLGREVFKSMFAAVSKKSTTDAMGKTEGRSDQTRQ